MAYKRTILHLGSADRTIAEIQMVGNYASITTDGGDFLTATWTGGSGSNNPTVAFTQLKKVGDTI
jgi:hypothetical protein